MSESPDKAVSESDDGEAIRVAAVVMVVVVVRALSVVSQLAHTQCRGLSRARPPPQSPLATVISWIFFFFCLIQVAQY